MTPAQQRNLRYQARGRRKSVRQRMHVIRYRRNQHGRKKYHRKRNR